MKKENFEKIKKRLDEEEKDILAELMGIAAQDPTNKDNFPKIMILMNLKKNGMI